MKIGRNDPCHCGSGEKYKKCHAAQDTAASFAELAARNAELARAREAALAEAQAAESAGAPAAETSVKRPRPKLPHPSKRDRIG
jgi:hypothetical protein